MKQAEARNNYKDRRDPYLLNKETTKVIQPKLLLNGINDKAACRGETQKWDCQLSTPRRAVMPSQVTSMDS